MKEVLASYVVARKRSMAGKQYSSPRIYLPTKLTSDSDFPFKEDRIKVRIVIRGRRLVIEKASKRILEKFGEAEEENLDLGPIPSETAKP